MTLQFISNIKAESLKLRRTHAFWLTLGGAGFIPLVNFIRITGRPDVFVPRMKDNTWAIHINDNWAPAASFLLPLYLILLISLIAQIEYGNNTWKQVYTTPRTYADIFFSKFFVVNILILCCFVLFIVFIVISGYAAFAINPDYPFTSRPVPWTHLISVSAKMYVSILGIVALQYGLSMRIKNFITPLGIGMALLIGGFMIRQWEHIAYYPYMHPALVYFANPGLESGTGDDAMKNSLIVCGMGLVAGFYSMCVRREKG
jgi:hypothetical protein